MPSALAANDMNKIGNIANRMDSDIGAKSLLVNSIILTYLDAGPITSVAIQPDGGCFSLKSKCISLPLMADSVKNR